VNISACQIPAPNCLKFVSGKWYTPENPDGYVQRVLFWLPDQNRWEILFTAAGDFAVWEDGLLPGETKSYKAVVMGLGLETQVYSFHRSDSYDQSWWV